MACHEKCTAVEWTEVWPKSLFPAGPPTHPYTGQVLHGTGVVTRKPGTGCFYTRDTYKVGDEKVTGSGCCLQPVAGAMQENDRRIPEILAKRKELVEAAKAAGEVTDPQEDVAKIVKDRPDAW